MIQTITPISHKTFRFFSLVPVLNKLPDHHNLPFFNDMLHFWYQSRVSLFVLWAWNPGQALSWNPRHAKHQREILSWIPRLFSIFVSRIPRKAAKSLPVHCNEELKEPKNEKELKSFLGAIQYLSKYIENLSAQTDLLRQLLKKNEWVWTPEQSEAFTQLKSKIAHYNSNLPNTITNDASTKGLGATLWQEQHNGELKPIAFASRFLSDTEKKYAINELELLAVVWDLEHFRLYIYIR